MEEENKKRVEKKALDFLNRGRDNYVRKALKRIKSEENRDREDTPNMRNDDGNSSSDSSTERA